MKSVNKSTYEMFGPQSEYESKVNATYKDKSGNVINATCKDKSRP